MPRKLRVEYEGALYHLMNRGDRRERIFLCDADRELFLETLGKSCRKTGWQVHALCLMANHFHLVAETPRANLNRGDAVVPGHLHNAVQPAAQVVRPPLQRALQVAARGRERHGLPEGGVRLRSLEPGPGEAAQTGAAAERVSLEQLAGV
jgi:hypothetical protein